MMFLGVPRNLMETSNWVDKLSALKKTLGAAAIIGSWVGEKPLERGIEPGVVPTHHPFKRDFPL